MPRYKLRSLASVRLQWRQSNSNRMYTFIALLFFCGCYLFYVTSKKRNTRLNTTWEKYFALRPAHSKSLGAVLFFLGWAFLVNATGWGAGTFAVLAYLMCFGSVLVLLAPFNHLKSKHVIVLSAVCLLLEYLLF